MRTRIVGFVLGVLLAFAGTVTTLAQGKVVFEATSPYHHIRVLDDNWVRTLSFDGSTESQMSLTDPLRRHFEYTEYFQMPWLWNGKISRVLMIGLGGASAQRAYEHYYPQVTVETVELDPMVVKVAKEYFHFKEGDRQKVFVEDGRVFLRRNSQQYDVIVIDAYTTGRYGSSIPYHLATKEFFELVSKRLETNGVVAYNVIGSLRGFQADILGAMYRTMRSVFPQVYLFPARSSDNVVLVGTKSADKVTLSELQRRANALINAKRITLWSFRSRLASFRSEPPPNARSSPLLTDDFAPVDGLLNSRSLGPLKLK